MVKSYVKISYTRRIRFGLPMPFCHTFFEIYSKGKLTKIAYFSLSDLLWCFSLLIPVPGEIRIDSHKPDYSIIVSRDPKKARKVLKLAKSKKYNWKVYLSLFRNCFHWRNAILKEAGLVPPRGDWFWRIN